jgi:predicted phosphoribosyltransferase
LFNDREDAGKQLAHALKYYKGKKSIVLAIPRGGVEVGYHVARFLHAEFSVIVARKLPYPDNPEAGFGAIAEDGSLFLLKEAKHWLPKETINTIIEEQKQEIQRRIKVLRQGKSLPEISNKTVILIDDGIAMGSTMQAAVMLCKYKKAKRIVVAAPVADEKVAEEFKQIVDDVVILEKPLFFHAVAQVYRQWHDVSDDEVLNLLEKS